VFGLGEARVGVLVTRAVGRLFPIRNNRRAFHATLTFMGVGSLLAGAWGDIGRKLRAG